MDHPAAAAVHLNRQGERGLSGPFQHGLLTAAAPGIKYVKDNQPKKVMMVTECSMSDNIQIENPNVDFVKPCNMCPHMKKITLPKILDCLENETGEIIMDKETIDKARISVERMAAIGR